MGRKVFLVDTNVFLELLLGQERAEECRTFIEWAAVTHTIAITEFTLYSIGIILEGRKRQESWRRFIDDCQAVSFILVSTSFSDEVEISAVISQLDLDLDDAHQYHAAKRLGAEFVSFDKDFDRTDLARREPIEFL